MKIINIALALAVMLATGTNALSQTFLTYSDSSGMGIRTVDSCGNVLREFPCIFCDVRLPDSSGSPAVAKIGYGGVWVAIDTLLEVKFSFPYNVKEVSGFRNGICVANGGRYGAFDITGIAIFEMEYDYVVQHQNTVMAISACCPFEDYQSAFLKKHPAPSFPFQIWIPSDLCSPDCYRAISDMGLITGPENSFLKIKKLFLSGLYYMIRDDYGKARRCFNKVKRCRGADTSLEYMARLKKAAGFNAVVCSQMIEKYESIH